MPLVSDSLPAIDSLTGTKPALRAVLSTDMLCSVIVTLNGNVKMQHIFPCSQLSIQSNGRSVFNTSIGLNKLRERPRPS